MQESINLIISNIFPYFVQDYVMSNIHVNFVQCIIVVMIPVCHYLTKYIVYKYIGYMKVVYII